MKLLKNLLSHQRLFILPLFLLIFLLNYSGSPFLELATETQIKISGYINSEEGLPLKNSKVLIYNSRESFPDNPSSVTFTRPNGSFKCKTQKSQSYVLEIQGDQGAGRIFIPAEKASGKLEITYPVIEKIIILHTNDTHFDLNLPQEKEQMINEIRSKNDDVFLMDAGDILVRHPTRWIVNGKLMENQEWYGMRCKEMISFMNKLGYDVMTLGNHELSPIEPYTRLALETARFPLLAANIEKPKPGLPAIEDYIIFETTTWRKLAVLGLSGNSNIPETMNKFSSLKNSSDIFMALTHIGIKNDSVLAAKFPVFDLIVGGHSHTLLKEAIMVNNVMIASAGGNPHFVSDDNRMYLGIVELILKNGVLTKKSGRVIQLTAKN